MGDVTMAMTSSHNTFHLIQEERVLPRNAVNDFSPLLMGSGGLGSHAQLARMGRNRLILRRFYVHRQCCSAEERPPDLPRKHRRIGSLSTPS